MTTPAASVPRLTISPTGDRRTGILFANLGTPDGTDYRPMRRFLAEFLSDRRVVDLPAWKWQPILQTVILTRRPFASGKVYRSIWNEEADESPMLTITRAQLEALRASAAQRFGDDVTVDLCMRYGNPSTAEVLGRMVEAGCTRILFVPLYPQYANPTWVTANDEFYRCLTRLRHQPATRVAEPYYGHPGYIAALAASVERTYASLDHTPDVLVASYHGMPERWRHEGDPYHAQCLETSRLLAERLGWRPDRIHTTFQSVFGREEWLRPYTIEHVAELGRQRRSVAVISPAFAADCVETLEEIDKLIRSAYVDAGGTGFSYVPCLNDDPAHIELLLDVAQDNLQGWQPA